MRKALKIKSLDYTSELWNNDAWLSSTQVFPKSRRRRITPTISTFTPSPLSADRSRCFSAAIPQEQITKYHKDVDFAYRPFLSLLGSGIVTSDGPKWRKQRNKAS